MSSFSEHEWELSRENIRPLREGRNVRSINSAFGGDLISMREAEAKFEATLQEAEGAEDALEVCARYVAWFEERFPTGKQSYFYRVLVRIINTFGNREEYKNDERMMKMWFKLAENKPGINADVFFERAYTAGCCRKLAKFFVRWAEVREANKDVNGARMVLSKGKENFAEPDSLLIEAIDALEMRQVRAMQEEDEDYSLEDFEPQRIALGGLDCPSITPVFRVASSVATGLAENKQAQPKQKTQAAGSAFEVFVGEDSFDDSDLLVPQYFGEDLGRVEFAENRKDPTKWKDARIAGIKSCQRRVDRSFEVFDEVAYMKKKKEKKALEKAMSCILAVDEINSVEELFAATII